MEDEDKDLKTVISSIGTSLAVQSLGPPSNAGGAGSVPNWEANSPHASQTPSTPRKKRQAVL